MTILVTGGRGKTALPLARLLAAGKYPLLVCTRSPKADAEHPSVRFDWDDESTWSLPFEHPQTKDSPITAVYLVGRDEEDPSSTMIRFISFAKDKGVKKFVLLSAWDYSVPEVTMLRAHEELAALEKSEGIEWAVLRPHFFMENFVESYQHHRSTIKSESKIYSAAEHGFKPFIAADDIAAVAFRTLTDAEPHNRDYIITGSQNLSYYEVADILTKVIGRKIEHISLPAERLAREKLNFLDPSVADFLAAIDAKIANDKTDRRTEHVQRVTGRPPKTFEEFAQENKGAWV